MANMAVIKGVTLKGVKNFTGHEGYGIEATIYLDGKKAGRYFDSADGGEPDIDFQSAELEKEAQKRAAAFFAQYPHKYTGLDTFLCILSDFIGTEKEYKKHAKKGHEIMIVQNGLIDSDVVSQKIFTAPKNISAERINKCKEQIINACVYTSLDDFIIA